MLLTSTYKYLFPCCRLRRRLESYRRRQTDCRPRFDQSFNGLCEQNLQDTLALKQRFLETKAKRQTKAKDKKQADPGGVAASGQLGGGGGGVGGGLGGIGGPQQGGMATAASLQSSVHVVSCFLFSMYF